MKELNEIYCFIHGFQKHLPKRVSFFARSEDKQKYHFYFERISLIETF